MTADELYQEFVSGFRRRKFSAGLLVAFIDLYEFLGVPGAGFHSFAQVLLRFPRQTTTNTGGHANTLIVKLPTGKTVSLRPFYDNVERDFHATHKRFDYPSAAPHATQAWADYESWLDALTTLDHEQLAILRDRVIQFVLDKLKSHEFDPASVAVEPPLFRLLLKDFDLTSHPDEPTGAAFQGTVFGFLRADNPHLQIEIDRVRTGSKRLQRIADIDGWDGARLAISAEVKHLTVGEADVDDFHGFATEVGKRGAIGLVVAIGFAGNARGALTTLGLKCLDREDLLRIVELWDPLKQRTAIASLIYYARHVEKNASLAERLDKFIDVASRASGQAPQVDSV